MKTKYIYNPKTLSYEPVKPGIKDYLKLGGTLIMVSLVLSVVFTFTYSYYFDSPEEAQLKTENIKLSNELAIVDIQLDSIQMTLSKVQDKDDSIFRILLGKKPLPMEIRSAGIGGYVETVKESNGFLITQRKIDKVKARLAVQNASLNELEADALQQAEILNSQPRIFPLREQDLIRFASPFGYREHPIFKIRKFHKGVDLTAARGTAVYATAPGTVVIASNCHDGYGNKVVIDHGNGYKTVYAHLSKIEVKKGQHIKLAKEIGKVGNTGRSIAPHLHYEVRVNDTPVNPVKYFYRDFTNEEFDQLVALGK